MFQRYHKIVYDSLDNFVKDSLLNRYNIPIFVSPNFVTYTRTALLVPFTLHFLIAAASTANNYSPIIDNGTLSAINESNYFVTKIFQVSYQPQMTTTNHIIPAALVITNLIFDFVDGAIARWERGIPHRKIQRILWYENIKQNPMMIFSSPPKILINGNDIENQNAISINIDEYNDQLKRNDLWGAYIDAIADKAFAIPTWIGILFLYPNNYYILQSVLYSHIGIEAISCYIRTKGYLNELESLKNKQIINSKVHAESIGKIKQILSMSGTALIILPSTSTLGFICMAGSLPLAFASVYRKIPR